MWLRLPTFCAGLGVVVGIAPGASAGPALDENTGAPVAAAKTEDSVEYGVGVRFRGIFLPKAEIELFVERAGDNSSNTLGFGLELLRRRGNTELQLGVEFEGFNPGQGVWIEKGDDVSRGDGPDVVLSRDDQPKKLGWVTFEFTYVRHIPLAKNFAFRWGLGGGLGVVLGELQHYDIVCNAASNPTNENPAPGCEPNIPPFNGTGSFEDGEVLRKYKLPPVFPVVNAIVGMQIRPIDKLAINLEGGIRTFLFAGISTSYFF